MWSASNMTNYLDACIFITASILTYNKSITLEKTVSKTHKEQNKRKKLINKYSKHSISISYVQINSTKKLKFHNLEANHMELASTFCKRKCYEHFSNNEP